MKREIVIRLSVPRWLKTRWTVLAGALVVGSAAVVWATVPNTFANGDLLSAQKLNDNFNALVDTKTNQTVAGVKTFSSIGVGATPPTNAVFTANGSNSTNAFIVGGIDNVNNSSVANFIGDTTGLSFGSTTLGRILRLTDSAQSKFYDLGIDGNGSFFVMNEHDTGEALVVNTSGNVGIGTTTPNFPLVVQSGNQPIVALVATNPSFGPFIGFDGTLDNGRKWNVGSTCGSAAQGQGNFLIRDDSLQLDRLLIDTNGNVGIGTDSPGTKLDVNGNIHASGTVTSASDVRLKTNIKTIENPLEAVQRLRGVTFDWKKDGTHSLGVIAQEVEKVYPELVSTAPDGMKAVDYGKLSAVLIEASKAQQKKIDSLEDRLARLEAKMNKRAGR